MSDTQDCRSCKVNKPIAEFAKSANGKSYLKTCLECKTKPTASAERKVKTSEKQMVKLTKLMDAMDLTYEEFKQSLKAQPQNTTDILGKELKFSEAKNAVQQLIVKIK